MSTTPREDQGPQQGCRHGAATEPPPPYPGEDSLDAFLERQAMQERLARIRHRIIVLSGKGGVGKSTVAVNLAVSLRLSGRRVGLLDVDIHGPSVPTMLRLGDRQVHLREGLILPVEKAGLKVMSIGFLLHSREDAVIWRGPRKMGMIKQFIKDVEWGDLDYLIVDSPPGTGDEPLSVCQLLRPVDGAVVVTTPQDVATADVRRSISFCRQLDLPVLGVVENMSGFVCPHCGKTTDIFKSGGGEALAAEMGVPFLGRIPIDPAVGESTDGGTPFVYHYARTGTAKAFERVVAPVLALSDPDEPAAKSNQPRTDTEPKEETMRIAIPVADGRLAMHFGHCEAFALLDVDAKAKTITKQETIAAPEHQPGLLPRWLAERGAQVIIAGGMGQRAQSLFTESGIKVVAGAPAEAPETLVAAYLDGTLKTGDNVCDH